MEAARGGEAEVRGGEEEEAEKAYEARLQKEEGQKEKGKRKVSEVAEDNEEAEKELSGSNKKVSDLIL
jgi:hypothetical protein